MYVFIWLYVASGGLSRQDYGSNHPSACRFHDGVEKIFEMVLKRLRLNPPHTLLLVASLLLLRQQEREKGGGVVVVGGSIKTT